MTIIYSNITMEVFFFWINVQLLPEYKCIPSSPLNLMYLISIWIWDQVRLAEERIYSSILKIHVWYSLYRNIIFNLKSQICSWFLSLDNLNYNGLNLIPRYKYWFIYFQNNKTIIIVKYKDQAYAKAVSMFLYKPQHISYHHDQLDNSTNHSILTHCLQWSLRNSPNHFLQ